MGKMIEEVMDTIVNMKDQILTISWGDDDISKSKKDCTSYGGFGSLGSRRPLFNRCWNLYLSSSSPGDSSSWLTNLCPYCFSQLHCHHYQKTDSHIIEVFQEP